MGGAATAISLHFYYNRRKKGERGEKGEKGEKKEEKEEKEEEEEERGGEEEGGERGEGRRRGRGGKEPAVAGCLERVACLLFVLLCCTWSACGSCSYCTLSAVGRARTDG